MVQVCKFWQKGYCRNGDRCNFEHPSKSGQPASSQNRFGPLDPGYKSSDNNRGSRSNDQSKYHLDKTTITNDISKERPIWILSSYGPGRDCPVQLFGGHPREQSFEEMRLRHYELAASGNQQQASEEAQNLVNNAEQQMQSALNDVDGAIKYIIDGERQHPNRIDVCKAKGTKDTQQSASRGAQWPLVASSATPAFGKPSIPPSLKASTFGQPSAFGGPSTVFGSPSQPSQSSTGFNQAPAFGQPAPLGPLPTAFGQRTSAFGQPSGPVPTFGQPFKPTPFGQQPKLEPPRPFSSQPVPSLTTSTFGQNIPAPSNPFSQQPVPTSNPFAQALERPSNLFNNYTVANSGFGQPSQQPLVLSTPPDADIQRGHTGPPTAPSLTAISSTQQSTFTMPVTVSNTKRDAQNRLTLWKGRIVRYFDGEPCHKRDDGAWEKIWFPDGGPNFTKTPELPEGTYDAGVREAYAFMREKGAFKDGIMPELPPRREWCRWEF